MWRRCAGSSRILGQRFPTCPIGVVVFDCQVTWPGKGRGTWKKQVPYSMGCRGGDLCEKGGKTRSEKSSEIFGRQERDGGRRNDVGRRERGEGGTWGALCRVSFRPFCLCSRGRPPARAAAQPRWPRHARRDLLPLQAVGTDPLVEVVAPAVEMNEYAAAFAADYGGIVPLFPPFDADGIAWHQD